MVGMGGRLAKAASLVLLTTAQVQADATSFDQNAGAALDQLMRWYNWPSGLFDTTGWWNAANCITQIADLSAVDAGVKASHANVWENTFANAPRYNPDMVKVTGQTAKDVVHSFYANPNFVKSTKMARAATGSDRNANASMAAALDKRQSSGFLNDYYDDEGWWALAWLRVWDMTFDQRYLNEAINIFNDMAASWPSPCNNGGIWWDKAHTSVNAVANELFMHTAASLAIRVAPAQKGYYIDWAQRSWAWFQASGMINADHTINDGLDASCRNNGGTVWSYNQGIIVGGLVELARATGDASYLDPAGTIAAAAIAHLTDANGILHDVCEPNCGSDGNQFKGILLRNVRMLQVERPDLRWYAFIRRNAVSIWANDLQHGADGGLVLGVNWAGPFVAPGTAATQSSALDALTAAWATR